MNVKVMLLKAEAKVGERNARKGRGIEKTEGERVNEGRRGKANERGERKLTEDRKRGGRDEWAKGKGGRT